MKNYLRLSFLNTFSLFIVASFYPGLIIPTQILELLWAGVIFTIINQLVKPIIKLFLLPINLITLGLFRWIANVVVLFILTNLITSIQVKAFIMPAIDYSGFAMPSFAVNTALTFILASFLLSLVFNLLKNILSEEE